MRNNALIQLENVCFHYEISGEKIEVLRNLSFSINAGEHVAILGHNGSGKSTLSKLLNGLLLPSQGEVRVDGLATSDISKIQQIRKMVGIVFQHPDNQMIAAIVEDDVAFGLENLQYDPNDIETRVKESLEQVDMTEHRKRPPHHLSGGQKQRVALAGILAMSPYCIVLDEASSMLDPKGKFLITTLVRDLHKQGMTIINITHNLSEAILADRLIVLEQGRIVRDEKPREFFSNTKAVLDNKLDFPFAKKIAMALHKNHPAFSSDLLFNHEVVNELIQYKQKAEIV